MADITFYTNPMSRGRIVRWMLEELGQPYDTVVVTYGPEMQGPDYRSINPMAKVPAVRHGDAVVTEAAAICAYLSEAFPDAGLAPAPGTPARAAFLRWMFFGAGPVEAAATNSAFGWTPSGPQEEGRVGYGSLKRVCDTLEAQLQHGPFLLGAEFSAVDVYLGSQIMWGIQFETLEKRPAFLEYSKRMGGRDAAVRAREIDDALMAEQAAQEQGSA
ncbi:MAG: glutathione S-transferase family protein [Pseudomonadota bacterium]